MNDETLKPHPTDLAAILVALALPTLITWIYFFQADSASAGIQQSVFGAVKVLQFLLPVAWVVGVRGRPLDLRLRNTRGVAAGLAFGVLVSAALFVLYFGWLRSSSLLDSAEIQIRDKVTSFGIDRLWKYLALGLFYSFIHSFLEEYYWRWFVFGELSKHVPVAPAVAISSLGFMAHHVLLLGKFFGFDSLLAWLFSACVAVGGAVWAGLYRRTASLLGPWLSHLLVDAAIFAVGLDLVWSLYAG